MNKVLVFDIETSPSIAYVWRFFKENVSPKQVLDHPHIMSYAAKWLGQGEIFYKENRGGEERELLQSLAALLDEADAVVAHNGTKFDLPKIKGRMLAKGLTPFSPVKMIDTYLITKKELGFSSNSLEYLCNILELKTKKSAHGKFSGFTLWAECLKGNEEAWAELKEYNILDVIALEELYLKLRPWSTNHPNLAVYAENTEKPVCPKCGGTHLQYRGYAYTSTGKYHRLQCMSCGGWSRSRYSLLPKNENLVVNQVN